MFYRSKSGPLQTMWNNVTCLIKFETRLSLRVHKVISMVNQLSGWKFRWAGCSRIPRALVFNWEGIGRGLNQVSLCTHRHQITLGRPTQEVALRPAAAY
jgi:hypothetical protein